MMDKFVKGDYNSNHCELWTDDEHFGDVRTDDADKFIDLINSLIKENNLLKKENNELKQPHCRKCEYFSCDNADCYCMKKGFNSIDDLNWARYCKEYESVLE